MEGQLANYTSGGAAHDLGLGILSSVNQGAAHDLGLGALSSLLGHNNPPQPVLPYKWYYVTPRFSRFLSILPSVLTSIRKPDEAINNVVASLESALLRPQLRDFERHRHRLLASLPRSTRLGMSIALFLLPITLSPLSAARRQSPVSASARGQGSAARDQPAH